MRCPSCGHENREGASFCDDCGTPLARACPNCGTELRRNAKFCDGCGASLTEAAPERTPTPEPAPALPAAFAAGRYQVQRFLGEGGEILVSSLLRELTESGGDIEFGEGREVALKGLTGT